MTKIRDLFEIWQGHQITDEEIYKGEKGSFPIITGHNEIKGYTKRPRITKVPCITIPSKGIVNNLYIQTKPFDANNTIVLVPRNREKIDLQWFKYTQTKYITSYISSTNTNNYLNRDILENIDISLPSLKVQMKIVSQYKKLFTYLKYLKAIEDKIKAQLEKMVIV